MFSDWRRRRAAGRVRPGTGDPLKRFRWWQPFSRSLFHLRLRLDDGEEHRYSVDVRHGGDDNGTVWANLYLDGRQHARSKLPAVFEVPGGAIEVQTSSYGLRRMHYVRDDGTARVLTPDRASAEGRRARLQRDHPGLSRAIRALSVVVLVIGVVLGIPQLLEQITEIPPVAENIGTFTSPIQLPVAVNVPLLLATLIASTERALRLRYHWILDGGLFDGDA